MVDRQFRPLSRWLSMLSTIKNTRNRTKEFLKLSLTVFVKTASLKNMFNVLNRKLNNNYNTGVYWFSSILIHYWWTFYRFLSWNYNLMNDSFYNTSLQTTIITNNYLGVITDSQFFSSTERVVDIVCFNFQNNETKLISSKLSFVTCDF